MSGVIRGLKAFSFKVSPYPMILSIENHCCLEQQEKMANIFINVLGNEVLLPGTHLLKGDIPGYLPSPELTKNKYYIKGKRLQAGSEEDDYGDVDDEDDDESTIKDGESDVDDDELQINTFDKLDTIEEELEGEGEDDHSLVPPKPMVSTESKDDKDENSFSPLTTSALGNMSGTNSASLASAAAGGNDSATNPNTTRSTISSSIPNKAMRQHKNTHRKAAGGASSSSPQTPLDAEAAERAARKAELKALYKKSQSHTHQKLSDLTYLGTCKHKNFNDSQTIPCDMMSSFSEGKTKKYLKKPEAVKAWIGHNIQHVR